MAEAICMFASEIEKLINRNFNWYIELFEKYDIKLLRNYVERGLSGERGIKVCFPGKLEELFQNYYFLKTIGRIRLILIFGIIMYLAFGLADYLLFPNNV